MTAAISLGGLAAVNAAEPRDAPAHGSPISPAGGPDPAAQMFGIFEAPDAVARLRSATCACSSSADPARAALCEPRGGEIGLVLPGSRRTCATIGSASLGDRLLVLAQDVTTDVADDNAHVAATDVDGGVAWRLPSALGPKPAHG